MRLQPGLIPPQMRALRQWIVWRTVQREDKDTKPPFCPRTGELARTHDQAGKTYKDRPQDTWGTFDDALACVHKSKGAWEGIGFVFTADDPFCGIDLDDCRAANGALNAQAKEIGRRLKSYTEVSPSGSGLHIIVRAVLPAGGNRRGDLEMYDRGRYFTITGNVVPGASSVIEGRQAEVEELHRSIFAPPNGNGKRPGSLTLSDAELLETARNAKNGGAFQALYDHGCVAMYDGDDSRADLALCGHLAFWAQGEEARVDRLFRGSALYRAKWDRADYSQRTIRKALAGKSEFYTPNGSHANGHSNGTGAVGYSPPEPIPDPSPDAPAIPADAPYFPPTEGGDADRITYRYSKDICWVPVAGAKDQRVWYAWDGRRWERGAAYQAALKARAIQRELYTVAQAMEHDEDRKVALKHAMRADTSRYREGMVKAVLADERLMVQQGIFDTKPDLLNCLNGTLNLQTGELMPHNPADRITKLCPVEYDLFAQNDLWDAFLLRILPDPEVRSFVQRAFGYALSGHIAEHCFFFLHGSGRNGKSVLLKTLLAVVGDYGSQSTGELLLATTGDRLRPEVAALRGQRLVTTIEVEDGRRFAESLVKQLTGGDRISARFLHENPLEFEPTHKIFLAANHRPVILGTDTAIWSRVKLVPFTEIIDESEMDPYLFSKLKDAALPAVLAWGVAGYAEWRSGGLRPPAAVTAAVQSYRAEQDLIGGFLETCVRKSGVSVNATRLYQAYTSWSTSNGEKPVTNTVFGRELTERGHSALRRGGQVLRIGIDLPGEGLDV